MRILLHEQELFWNRKGSICSNEANSNMWALGYQDVQEIILDPVFSCKALNSSLKKNIVQKS